MASKSFVFDGTEERIDRYLARALALSRERIQDLISRKQVLVNDRPVANSHKLRPGEHVSVLDEQTGECRTAAAESAPLDILFEDDQVIVLNKPAGILTHPTVVETRGTLVNHLLAHTELSRIGAPWRPGVVHRLDRETSGAIVFAKTDQAYWNMVEQFKNRQVEKIYHALVEGEFTPGETVAELTMQPSRNDPTRMEVRHLKGKKMLTKIKMLRRLPKDLSLLEVKPVTGRTHQIRITLAHLGFPVLGDAKYGQASPLIARTALHAYSISFLHPSTGQRLTFTASLPAELGGLMNQINT